MAFPAAAFSSQRLLSSAPRVAPRTFRLYSGSRGRSRSRKEEEKRLGKSSKELDWEHYEFSLNPKQDNRFGSNAALAAGENLDEAEEAREDRLAAKKMEDENNAFKNLDPQIIKAAKEILEPFINEDRLQRVSTVLKQRTKRSKFLFENPSNPSNVWACLRTIDSFGIQNVDVVIESGMYSKKQALNQKRGMRTAMGSAQWLSLKNHGSTADAIREIRDVQGYKVYASDLNPNSKDVREIDWDEGPICIVMGNEDRGISEEMRELADETFTLPMCGFAESFNLSVATSITLAHMSANSSEGKGPLRPGDLDDHEFNCLYLKGLLNSLPQKRTGNALLKQNGIELPEIFDFL
eukprot:CAMPEP_0197256360 /NCGR_PEP_ID=MMETSP1429-20130617/75095_1 /TAXON_ID=49237 /ORGANISM="Chaetoceros  sp., Strain UNC1202" /LENGTH=350 /DNA_ID=CAMNT_0042719901 /DNA_START=1 /DNA_END=1053 /DNA_ORIENTATION=-